MRPVSGDDLVAAALQSSLARAQKNYFSNYKQLKSSGLALKTKKSAVGCREIGIFSTIKKPKSLKFQSEFALWIQQTSDFTFVTEDYTNGAEVPDGIECLNSTGNRKRNKLKNYSPGGFPSKKVGKDVFQLELNQVKTNKSDQETSCLKGKAVPVGAENSFELLQKIKESRKEKKKIVKIKKRLSRQGLSSEEIEKIIAQAKKTGSGGGAIFQRLQQVALSDKTQTRSKDLNTTSKRADLLGGSKKVKMRDISEHGESSHPTPSRPETPASNRSTSNSSSPGTAVMNGGTSNVSGGGSFGSGGSQQHQLPQPKRVLYPREKIIPGYVEKMPVGAGFFNMGNSCYLNASLQAIFHVPAFTNWLREDTDHRRVCQDNVNCIICAMKKTFDAAMAMSRQSSGSGLNSAIRPVEIINRLRSICRHFSHGRQEDAHEFLRYLFESMERSYLAAINGLRLDNRSKETNPLGQIFGGYLRTEVTCLKCNYVSTTFQPTAELQLDIRHVTTLEDAILNLFKKERLDNNDYKCEKCRTISQATKQHSLEIPPIVLCLQLKRFTLYGTKITKRIHCNKVLDMSKYMHKSKQVNGFSNLRYRLVALVTHLGSSPNCGHYTAIAEACNGNFYQFDDSYVHQVTVANALNNDAYVIIYEMDKRHKPTDAQATSASGYSTNLSFPTSTITSNSPSSTLSPLYPKNLPSKPIPKLASTSPASASLTHNNENEMKPNGVSTATNGATSDSNGSVGHKGSIERNRISFGLRASTPPNKINIWKPGVSLTNSSKLSVASPSSNSRSYTPTSSFPPSSRTERSEQKVKLVPYNDDENEESDKDENCRNGALMSSNKRLKSPEGNKQSPGRNNVELPITPPKSPKPTQASPSTPSSAASTLSNKTLSPPEHEPVTKDAKPPADSDTNNIQHRDSIKRKAPSEDEPLSRKSRSQRRRHSSSSSSSSSSSRSTSSSGSRQQNGNKRKRSVSRSSEQKSSSHHNSSGNSGSRRERNHSARDSQERDRERRRARNPSRSPSEDAKEKGGPSSERQGSSNGGTTFDVSRIKTGNAVLAWDGQKSFLSRSMEADQKRFSAKTKDEEYDDEFDQGKTKKVRRSRSLPRESEGLMGNRFQSVDDKKKQLEKWSSITNVDGHGSASATSFQRSDSVSGSSRATRNWFRDGEDSSRYRDTSSRPRPRHSSTNSSHSNPNYSRNSHGRSPYKNGHHHSNNSVNGGNHYRNQSHGSYPHNSNNSKSWNNDRNRH